MDAATRARAAAAGQNVLSTVEGMFHTPMPFTSSGQTISDRLEAAKHSLAGSQLGKTVCKATTEEVMGPKKKHLDCKSLQYIATRKAHSAVFHGIS